MADLAHVYTDKQIEKLQHELDIVYKQAEIDIRHKMEDFNKKYRVKEKIHQKELRDGKITQEQYDNWVKGQVFQGQQWQAKHDQILDTMHRTNEVATNMINGQTQNVFMANANYMSYSMEHDTGINFGFGIYDNATVVNLIKNEPQLLPKWKIDQPKDYTWSNKKLNRSITQGIIQGESLDKIADRLSNKLVSQNKDKMKTFARTAMTGAQNSGRLTSMRNAKDLGIDLQKEWMATLDSHTRDSHADVDGERVDVNSKFSNGLMYPGEAGGAPAEVYNCRCTMVSDIKKYPDKYKRYDNIDGKPIDNMSYKEWAKAKGLEKKRKSRKETESESKARVVSPLYESARKRGEDFLKRARQDVERSLSYGVSEDQAKEILDQYDANMRELEQNLSKLFDENSYYVNIPQDKLDSMLHTHLKSQQEIIAEGGNEGTNKLRTDAFTKQIFGYKDQLSPDQNPTFGSLGSNDWATRENYTNCSIYGGVSMRLKKDNLDGATTWISKDGYGAYRTKGAVAGVVEKGNVSAAGIARKDWKGNSMSDPYKTWNDYLKTEGNSRIPEVVQRETQKQAGTDYLELQFHTRITINDIESLCMSPESYKAMSEDTINILKDHNISLYTKERERRSDGTYSREYIITRIF